MAGSSTSISMSRWCACPPLDERRGRRESVTTELTATLFAVQTEGSPGTWGPAVLPRVVVCECVCGIVRVQHRRNTVCPASPPRPAGTSGIVALSSSSTLQPVRLRRCRASGQAGPALAGVDGARRSGLRRVVSGRRLEDGGQQRRRESGSTRSSVDKGSAPEATCLASAARPQGN